MGIPRADIISFGGGAGRSAGCGCSLAYRPSSRTVEQTKRRSGERCQSRKGGEEGRVVFNGSSLQCVGCSGLVPGAQVRGELKGEAVGRVQQDMLCIILEVGKVSS